MRNKPKISVIMSVYNGMPFLKEAVKSILKQTYKNFEFIIVDDVSKDDTWRYLKSLRDMRIKLIQNKKNLGLAASLNIAIRQAQGDFVARMDADDISLSGRFKTQIEFFKKNPSIGICGTWADLIDEKDVKVGEKKHPTDDKSINKDLIFYNPVIHPTLMAKKEVFIKLKGYNPQYDFVEDYDFLLRAKNYFKIANVPKKLLMLRLSSKRRSQNSMSKMDKMELAMKVNNLKEEFSYQLLFAVIEKFLMTYLLPSGFKLRLARILKLA